MVVAIVTGASRGLGRAIALQLADDGMDLAINDIQAHLPDLESLKEEIEKKGRRAICVTGDVSNEEQVQSMVKQTVDSFGELNVMVANAGIMVTKGVLDLTLAEWEGVQKVNSTGAFLCYREAGRQMVAQGKGGKIIGACSIAGYRPSGNALAYSTSKWAVRGLTQAVALDLAQYNINVNAYCPGPVGTAMWEAVDECLAKRDSLAKGEAFEKSVQARSAFKRASTPEDIANLVSFLASPKSRNITGQSMICDGGITFS
ncbi:uncharacterized protein N7479_010075 [Penicillium vulpinum]|uniref:Diacetyl reductase [(S)-acetoin forming] n=1 Tax=Penicillium vulpinum TaxID=29845 RepID=A0A1V6RV15_9EURO|nr:uncharacterized protein N7479_010075 [Penicillium vulpinum]KAJ5951662.1 hypothetical protein N7479_010075 [Penicillium vulpinum]OQE05625.1 hypothetical protein PENVUL_c023G02534 [Penicillium vulpinum]